MDITLSQIIVVAAGILTLMNLADKAASWAHQIRAPESEKIKEIEAGLFKVTQRLDDHDRIIEKHAGFFDVDKRRLDVLENGNQLACKALLALLRHANGDSNYEEMQGVEKELNGYVWKKIE